MNLFFGIWRELELTLAGSLFPKNSRKVFLYVEYDYR